MNKKVLIGLLSCFILYINTSNSFAEEQSNDRSIQQENKEPKKVIKYFNELSYDDNLFSIIDKVSKFPKLEKFSLYYNWGVPDSTGWNSADINFERKWDLKKIKNFRETFSKDNAEVLKYFKKLNKTYPSDSGFMNTKVEYLDQNGNYQKTINYEGMTLEAFPIVIDTIPFKLKIRFLPTGGLFLTKSENVIKDKNNLYFPFKPIEISLSSDNSRISDKLPQLIQTLEEKFMVKNVKNVKKEENVFDIFKKAVSEEVTYKIDEENRKQDRFEAGDGKTFFGYKYNKSVDFYKDTNYLFSIVYYTEPSDYNTLEKLYKEFNDKKIKEKDENKYKDR